MPSTDEQNADANDTGEFPTGEHTASDLDRTRSAEPTSSHRRRRRRSKRKKKEKFGKTLTVILIGLLCGGLVGIGVLMGVSYHSDQSDSARYRQALQARQAAHSEWLDECKGLGYDSWTCNRFDRVHFQKAKTLDKFACAQLNESSHRCTYELGSVKVLVTLPEPYESNGNFLAPRERATATIGHSNHDDQYFVAISDKGRIEIRDGKRGTALFIVNPATGSLNALHANLKPDQ